MEKTTKKETRSVKQISVSALALILSAVLLFGAVVGGTLAWLMRKSETLTNTFTLGNITSFTLYDDKANASNNYKAPMDLYVNTYVPKSTSVTIGSHSVDCYIYVKVETSGNYSRYLEAYQMADGWKQLYDIPAGADDTPQPVTGVFYREYVRETDGNTDQTYYVLKSMDADGLRNGYLKAKANFPVDDLEEYYVESKKPWIRFTGYAVQKEAGATAAGAYDTTSPYLAWVEVNEQIAAGEGQNNSVAP